MAILSSYGITEDILVALKSEPSFSVCFTPRQGNRAADWIAVSINKEVCPIGWVGLPLPSLSQLLDEDRKSIGCHQVFASEQPTILDLD